MKAGRKPGSVPQAYDKCKVKSDDKPDKQRIAVKVSRETWANMMRLNIGAKEVAAILESWYGVKQAREDAVKCAKQF